MRNLLASGMRFLHLHPRPSLNDLDRKLEKYIGYQNGFFIEAGANDGYSQSNTYYLEKKQGWTGLLIEGIPELYEKCKKRRTRSIVKNYALTSSDYSGSAVTMHYANLMSVVDGALKTEDEQSGHIKTGLKVQHLHRSYQIDVPARTLESILDEIPELPDIDIFSLDVEGYELPVLKGLKLTKYRPKYILVEASYFEDVNAFLVNQSYKLMEQLSCHDYIYIAKELL